MDPAQVKGHLRGYNVRVHHMGAGEIPGVMGGVTRSDRTGPGFLPVAPLGGPWGTRTPHSTPPRPGSLPDPSVLPGSPVHL